MMYSLVPTRPLSEDFSLDEPSDSIELERVFCDAKMLQIATTEFAGPPILYNLAVSLPRNLLYRISVVLLANENVEETKGKARAGRDRSIEAQGRPLSRHNCRSPY